MSTEIDERVCRVKNIHVQFLERYSFFLFSQKIINELFNRLDNKKTFSDMSSRFNSIN